MKPASARRPEIIRMFPDYADTVLWLDGPIDYGDTGLSTGLIVELQAWEQLFYDSLNRNYDFRSRGLEARFTREGIHLAELISTEIGSGHIIEYLGAQSLNHPVLFQCPGTAANPAAATCFDDLVEAKLRAARDMQEILKDEPLYAYAPLSESVFDPHGITGTSGGPGKSKK